MSARAGESGSGTGTAAVLERSAEGGPGSPFRRVLLKLSGEALMGSQASGVDLQQVERIAEQVRRVRDEGVQMAIVVGGGNFIRGVDQAKLGMDRATGDYMGMIGTILNALPVQDALERAGVPSRVLSALELKEVAEPYIRRRALRHLEKHRVVIFAGGTGNPYVTTDTAGALRALEIGAQAMLMAKNGVDGVYDKDPRAHADAQLLPELTHREAISRNLGVMDQTALTLLCEQRLPIHVFNMDADDSILRVARGEHVGTIVRTPKED